MTNRRPVVLSANEVSVQPVEGANGTYRVLVDEAQGCENLIQRVFRYESGASTEMINPDSDDVVYVVSGVGEAIVGGKIYSLKPDTGLLVPQNTTYSYRVTGSEPLELVSVLSPQPGRPASVPPSDEAQPITDKLTLHESEEEEISAGKDRTFKLMIDPRYGSRYVTQFIGLIKRVRAPQHTHTYEEVIYILGGEGLVHIEGEEIPIRAGSTIYLPPGVVHYLENRRDDMVLSLVGVFCPAGSPANKKDETG